MVQPKSILKKPSAGPSSSRMSASTSTAGPSSLKPKTGSKLQQSITLTQKPKRSIPGSSADAARASKQKARKKEEDDDQDEDDEMDGSDEADEAAEDDIGTDEEIERAQSKGGKSKPAVKRKRPTTADEFGSALTSLLTEPSRPTKTAKPTVPAATANVLSESTSPSTKPIVKTETKPKKGKSSSTQPILALSRSKLPPTATTEKLERQAARAVKREKEEKEDRARVKDVVEGWSHRGAAEGEVIGGLEFEKGLRKTAQRGVIKLFNAILTASRQETANVDPAAATIAKSAALAGVKGYGKKDKDNALGRGNKDELTKEGFLDLVKRGSGI